MLKSSRPTANSNALAPDMPQALLAMRAAAAALAAFTEGNLKAAAQSLRFARDAANALKDKGIWMHTHGLLSAIELLVADIDIQQVQRAAEKGE